MPDSAAPIIETVAVTGSTNADLVERLAGGEAIPESTWLRAERQQAGRGRQGRSWQSPPGNLYCSTMVQLRPGDPAPHTLTFVAALAAHDAVAALCTGADVQLKWPNDLLAGGSKLAGILLQRQGRGVIVGIGINCASAPELPDRATTCLAAMGSDADPADVLLALTTAFAVRTNDWRLDLSATLTAWQDCAHPIGTPLTIALAEGGTVSGSYAGLSTDGALQLRDAQGGTTCHYAGDVSLR